MKGRIRKDLSRVGASDGPNDWKVRKEKVMIHP